MTNLTKKFWMMFNLTLPTLALSQGLMQRNIDGTLTPYQSTGKFVAHDTTVTATPSVQPTAQLLIVADRPYYQPGDMIRLWLYVLGSGVDQGLHIMINETFSDDSGIVSTDNYPCDCGGSNAGWISRGFAPNDFRNLLNKQIPPFRLGKYTFTVTVEEQIAGQLGQALQSSSTTVYSVASLANGDDSPLTIRAVIQGQSATLLSGRFPQNAPMYFYYGVFPYTGIFTNTPNVISTDGVTITLPFSTLGSGGRQGEGRVWLMTADGQLSAVSSSFIY